MTKKRISFLLVAIVLVIALVGTALMGCSSKVKEANSGDVLMKVIKGAVAAADGTNFANFEVGANAEVSLTEGTTTTNYTIVVGGKINLAAAGTEMNIVINKGDSRVLNIYYKDTGTDSDSTVFLATASKFYAIKALSLYKVLSDKVEAEAYANIKDSTARYSDVDFDSISSTMESILGIILPNDIEKGDDMVSAFAKMNKKGTKAEISIPLSSMIGEGGHLSTLIAGAGSSITAVIDPLGLDLDISKLASILPALNLDLSFEFGKAVEIGTEEVNPLTSVSANLSVGAKAIDIKSKDNKNFSLLKFNIANDLKVEIKNATFAFGAGSAPAMGAAQGSYTPINAINLSIGGTVVGTKEGTATNYTLEGYINIDPTFLRDFDFARFSRYKEEATVAFEELFDALDDLYLCIYETNNPTNVFLGVSLDKKTDPSTSTSLTIKALGGLSLDLANLIPGLIIENLPSKAAYDQAITEQKTEALLIQEAEAFVATLFNTTTFKYSNALTTLAGDDGAQAAEAAFKTAGYSNYTEAQKKAAEAKFTGLWAASTSSSATAPSLDRLSVAATALTEEAAAGEWVNTYLMNGTVAKYNAVTRENYSEILDLLNHSGSTSPVAPAHGYNILFTTSYGREAVKAAYDTARGTTGASLDTLFNTTLYMVGDILSQVGIELASGVTLRFDTSFVRTLLSALGVNLGSFSGIVDLVLGYDHFDITINSIVYGGYIANYTDRVLS